MEHANIIAELAGQFGPTGLIIGYLVWERRTSSRERMTYDRERLEADKALAASLAALKTTIERIGP